MEVYCLEEVWLSLIAGRIGPIDIIVSVNAPRNMALRTRCNIDATKEHRMKPARVRLQTHQS